LQLHCGSRINAADKGSRTCWTQLLYILVIACCTLQ